MIKKRNKIFRKIKYYLHKFQYDCPNCQNGIIKLETLSIVDNKQIYKCSWCKNKYVSL